jgi:hypothetical protein
MKVNTLSEESKQTLNLLGVQQRLLGNVHRGVLWLVNGDFIYNICSMHLTSY